MKIAVFCSANEHIDPEFFVRAEELGKWMATEGHTLVFGGTDMGLMKCIARAVHEEGGHTIGVVPSLVEERGRTSRYNDVEIPCDNLSDRKDLMLLQSDVVIALPGGLGTLDEIFTVVASATIGYHHKRVILYNIKDFWAPLLSLLDQLQAQGLVRGHYTDHIVSASSLNDIKLLLADI